MTANAGEVVRQYQHVADGPDADWYPYRETMELSWSAMVAMKDSFQTRELRVVKPAVPDGSIAPSDLRPGLISLIQTWEGGYGHWWPNDRTAGELADHILGLTKAVHPDATPSFKPAEPAGRVVCEMVRTAPDRIWLQVGDESEYRDEPFPPDWHTAEITWCADSVVAAEVPYIRADLACASPAAPVVPASDEARRQTDIAIGSWLSAALDDDGACAEFKDAIKQWFDARPLSYFEAGENNG